MTGPALAAEETTPPRLYPMQFEAVVRRALAEDLGRAGDLTTDSLIEPGARARARLVAREEGRVAGIDVAGAVFSLLEPSVAVDVVLGDGSEASAGALIARIEGPARALLTGERVALNFLGHLSGIATETARAVAAVAGLRARIVCTRKTTPGLRALEKYAVRCGGGSNHRFGLDDAVLIKDNHLVAAGGIRPAVERVRARLGHMVKVEVEVDTLDQLRELIPLGVDNVLLDNMTPETLARAVEMVKGRMTTEASGGITPDSVSDVAQSGVDMISLGWLTHSAPALDVALELDQD